MDYTREPIVESVITSREGCKLVIRSSKGMNQEEYFLDAVELVTFGSAQFFRSLEKPKPFLLPVLDYEVLEVREPRMVLKNVGIDRSIKIGNTEKKQQQLPKKEAPKPQQQPQPHHEQQESAVQEEKLDDKQKRQKRSHRRRGAKNPSDQEEGEVLSPEEQALRIASPSAISALLAPPTTLISETISKYRNDSVFKQAFYEKDEEAQSETSVIAAPREPFTPDADFDEGDHILFRGNETSDDSLPFNEEIQEETTVEMQQLSADDLLKDPFDQPTFEENDDQ